MPVIVLDHLTFAWPDGSVALDDVSGTLRDARTGLVGRNGSGKSTLLKLIAGELSPTSGAALVDDAAARVAYLPQRLTLDTRARVASLLGVATPLDAVRAIAVGDVAPERFDEVGDDWDVEARSHAALAEAGLDPSVLDRRVGELSGGEGMLAALTGIRLAAASVTLLDEPTNNLDGDARQRVYDMVRSWRGTLVIVSHDLDLLELMDATAELHGHQLTVFGGPYSEWRAAVDAEQEAARQDLTDAKKVLAKEKRQRIELETKIARRNRQGKKKAETLPTIVANAYARRAEESAGRLRIEARGKEGSAQAARDEADARIRSDDSVVFDLPDPGVAAGRRILTLGDGDRQWIVQGPERVALVGPNGAGKTSLLRALLGIGDASAGAGNWQRQTPSPKPRPVRENRIRNLTPCAMQAGGIALRRRSCTQTGWHTCRNGWRRWTMPSRQSTRCSGRRRIFPIESCAIASRDSSSVAKRRTGRSATSPAASGSASRSHGCCSRIRHPSCSCWTNPPTTSTSIRPSSCSRPYAPTAVRCSSSVTTRRSCAGSRLI